MVNHISFLFFTLLWHSRAISTSGIMHNYMNGNRDSSSSTHNPPPRPSPPQTSQTQQHQTHQQQQQQHHQQQQHRQNGYIFQHTSIFITIKNWFDFCLHWYWKYQLFGDWLTSVYSKWDLSFWPSYLESFLR